MPILQRHREAQPFYFFGREPVTTVLAGIFLAESLIHRDDWRCLPFAILAVVAVELVEWRRWYTEGRTTPTNETPGSAK
jgi:hypothetical protein